MLALRGTSHLPPKALCAVEGVPRVQHEVQFLSESTKASSRWFYSEIICQQRLERLILDQMQKESGSRKLMVDGLKTWVGCVQRIRCFPLFFYTRNKSTIDGTVPVSKLATNRASS